MKTLKKRVSEELNAKLLLKNNKKNKRQKKYKNLNGDIQIESLMEEDPAYKLNTQADHYPKLMGLSKSSALKKLYEIFGLYKLRMHSGKAGVNVAKVSVTLTDAESNDLFNFLETIYVVKEKLIKSDKRKPPYFEGTVIQKTITLNKMLQVERLFDIFDDMKPETSIYQMMKDLKLQDISQKEYLQFSLDPNSGPQLFRTSLAVEKTKGMKGNFYIQYNQVPTIKGGILTFRFWYEMFGFVSKSQQYWLEKKIIPSEKKTGFYPYTLKNHPFKEEEVALAGCLNMQELIDQANSYRRREYIDFYEITLSNKFDTQPKDATQRNYL